MVNLDKKVLRLKQVNLFYKICMYLFLLLGKNMDSGVRLLDGIYHFMTWDM